MALKLDGRLLASVLILATMTCCRMPPSAPAHAGRIVVAPDGHGFIFAGSKKPFQPWGVNYGNSGRLIEDFWDTEWQTVAEDFAEMKSLGVNVVRVHLQFGKFMSAPNQPNRDALVQLQRVLSLAESNHLFLDITGLACYRPTDTPPWYDALDEISRWQAQANFWRAIARECALSPAVFCYDLMNEPISPADRKANWYSGNLFGGLDFVQYIAREPAGRTRGQIATAWINQMSAAIREQDRRTMITVGMLPWVTGWKHLSGFVPAEIAPHVDFISVHVYPKSNRPEEAVTALQECVAGKPVVIEETFPLECNVGELETFVRDSRDIACGWIWHYDGFTPAQYEQMSKTNSLTLPQVVWRDALKSFVRLRPEMVPVIAAPR